MYLSNAIAEFISRKPNTETQRAYREDLTQLLDCVGDAPVDSITVQDIATFKANLRRRRSARTGKPLSPATVNKRLKLTRTFFSWCVKQKLIAESPAAEVRLLVCNTALSKKAIPDETLKAMIAALRQQIAGTGKKVSRQPERDLFILLALSCAGLRRGDMPSLRFADVDIERREFTLFRKGDRVQIVPVSHQCIEALQEWYKVRPTCEHDYVLISFRSADHPPLTARGISSMFRKLCKRVTGQSRGPHSVRHRFVFNALDNGIPVTTIQSIGGWSTPEMIYRNYGVSDLDDQHRAIDQLNDDDSDDSDIDNGAIFIDASVWN
jgi:integrase/recombinase XerD